MSGNAVTSSDVYNDKKDEVLALAKASRESKRKHLEGLLAFSKVALQTFEEFYPYDKDARSFNEAHAELCKDLSKFMSRLRLEMQLLGLKVHKG